jgi:hypothetical protein
MKAFNYLFVCFLFLCFFLPSNSTFILPIGGISIPINELGFLILPLFNLFSKNENSANCIAPIKIRTIITIYIGYIVVNEFVFKFLIYGQSFFEAFKSIRIGIPFLSSVFILLVGLRVNLETVWRTLLYAIGASVIISFISLFVNLPIYTYEGNSFLEASLGRIANYNSSFGIIGICLLLSDKKEWYNKGRLVYCVSILSILSLIVTFNRTYIAALFGIYLYFMVKQGKISFKQIIIYPICVFIFSFWIYNTFDIIARQIDNRILSVITMQDSLAKKTIDGNRDMIYEGMIEKINEGNWFFGLPAYEPIYIRKSVFEDEFVPMFITDTSFANVLLRYGIIALLLMLFCFISLRKSNKNRIYLVVYCVLLLSSFNIDSLFRHNSIFFLIILYIITKAQFYEKSSVCR